MISSPLSATKLLFLSLPAEKSFALGEANQESPSLGKQVPLKVRLGVCLESQVERLCTTWPPKCWKPSLESPSSFSFPSDRRLNDFSGETGRPKREF